MKNIILIGGRDPSSVDFTIEKYITSFKKNPNILFFPTASQDSFRNTRLLVNLFSKYTMNMDFMRLFSNPKPSKIKRKLEWADILYFSGGSTELLVNTLKIYGIDEYLRNTSKLIVGISAGCIMCAKSGMGDSYSYNDNGHLYNLKMTEGLGLLNCIVCPHYQNDSEGYFNDALKEYGVDAYALENDTAIHFIGNDIRVIKSNPSRSVYVFRKSDDYCMKTLNDINKISALGPAGTYCDIAAKDYIKSINKDVEINYCSTIKKTIDDIKNTRLAVVPFENTLDGYVLETVDSLIKNDYHIVAELNEQVEFAFVSNATNLSQVKNVFVQFKAKGECSDFLTENNFNLFITNNNMESLNSLADKDETYGAIIPMHKVKDVNYNLIIEKVDDRASNYTRFVVVSKDEILPKPGEKIKCCLCLFIKKTDKAGLLFNVLKKFNDHNINLTAIMSRPTKEALGKYNFYIEISSSYEDMNNINRCIDEIEQENVYDVKNLGMYSVK